MSSWCPHAAWGFLGKNVLVKTTFTNCYFLEHILIFKILAHFHNEVE